MQHQSAEAELLGYFRSGGELLRPEADVLEGVIREIMRAGGHVSSKAIILCLIRELESTSDVVELDILRKTLEIVVGHTPDDSDI